MTNLLLSGCYGKLGSAICDFAETRADLRIAAGIDPGRSLNVPRFPVFTHPAQVDTSIRFDVLIDCSHPAALHALLDFALREKLPTVIATTGLSETQTRALADAAKKIPCFYSRNMSLGAALLKALARQAAHTLGASFDIEIVEAHHNRKIDAPSGTALLLAEAVNEALDAPRDYCYDRHSREASREKNEIGIHSLRGGTIVGTHSVVFAGYDETVTLTHTAGSKRLFAGGCVNAALFLKDKPPALYGMDDLVACLC
jgi:4-hydroxy-tetrahydrodipicolinate reductase